MVEGLQGLADARALVRAAAARGFAPPRRRSVKEWAYEERVVPPESGSPFPGRWSKATPYLDEVMEVLSDPGVRRVTFVGSAQIAKSEAGLNLIGASIADDPGPVMVVLPTTDEVTKYIDTKLSPMIEATPCLADKVADTKSRDEDGSTKRRKKFPGGFVQVTHASASAGLQMLSVRRLVLEEPSEYPDDVDGRGDPIRLAERRTEMWSGRELVYLAGTPALSGACRVSAAYEASDQRRFFVPCPHCGTFQVLVWERFDKGLGETGYPCAGCGVLLTNADKPRMLARGVWIKCFAEPGDEQAAPALVLSAAEVEAWRQRPSAGRAPGFHLWAAYAPRKSWGAIVQNWRDVKTPADEKTFVNQVLGEAYAPKHDAPEEDQIAEAADKAGRHRTGFVPAPVLVLTGAADVQGDRIEWAVWGFDEHGNWFDVDRSVIEGDASVPEPWMQLDKVVEREWLSEDGRRFALDAFGVDSGFKTQSVYAWARRHAWTHRVYALKGVPGWMQMPLGAPKRMDVDFLGKKIGEVQLWPVGSFDLKAEFYDGLRKLRQGRGEDGRFTAGTVFLSDGAGRETIAQMTAEYVAETRARNGSPLREWRRISGRANEQLDLAVYARALWRHLFARLTPAEVTALIARRRPATGVQEDLFSRGLVASLDAAAAEAPADAAAGARAAPPEPETPPAQAALRADDWFDRGEGFW